MSLEIFLCRVVTVVMFAIFLRENFAGTALGTVWAYCCFAFSAWATELLKDLASEPAAVQVWCETCEGERVVHEEHQIGVVGSGGEYPCPDCDGAGYRVRVLRP